ncbi:DMT family transporter [Aquabacterium sp. OR-4]|uniref:DMT family transporter n=1 Tax=Aquabacterium sp. OR-4 TaxID=2978127 RepID=UPI0021B453C8|nr:multidrug efflux SMR transporter [Aquabacterium sp. OR-4]MDT7837688.1 multidrug efflux SMR transporter [Aquabacterium sp. OR-4]
MGTPSSIAGQVGDKATATEPGPNAVPPLYWLLLSVAIISEVAATSLLKFTEGFTRLWPSAVVIVLYELSFILLTVVTRRIAVPVVYATWGGVGVAMVTVVAWAWLGQSLDAAALLGIGMITAGVIVIQGFSETTHA